MTSLYDKTAYLKTQDVGTILTRSYQLAEYSWNTTQTEGTSLGSIRMPSTLHALAWPKNILGAYKYFRCKAVELSFRVQSTPMHQGCLAISYVFNEQVGDTTTFRGIYGRRRNNRPTLLSPMPGNSAIVRIPWNNPEQWARVSDISNDTFNIGVCDIDIMVPLRSVAPVVADVKITVFANFIDPEVAGPTLYVAQSAQALDALSKAASGTMDTITKIAKPVEEAISLASSVVSSAALVLDKPSSADAPTRIGHSFGQGQMDINGVATEVVFGAAQSSSLSQQAGVMGDSVPNPSLGSLLRTPGYHGQVDFHAANTSTWWSVTPVITPTLGSNKYAPPYLTYFSMPFAYWRGSITYQVFFYCSSFTSARFRITWIPNHNGASVLTNQQGNIMSRVVEVRGDTHTTVTVPYAKPELWSDIQELGEAVSYVEMNNGTLQIDRISVSSIVTDPYITAVVYAHGGPDFEVGRYSPQMFETSTVTAQQRRQFVVQGEEMDAPSNFVWDYADVSHPIYESSAISVGGYAQSEVYSDFCSLLKRFHKVYFDGATGNVSLPPITPLEDWSRDPITLLSCCFRYWRGGLRCMLLRPSNSANTVVTVLGDHAMFVRDNTGSFDLNVPFCIPYYDNTPFRKTGYESVPKTIVTASEPEAGTTTWAAQWCFADDVGVSGLFSPMILLVTTNP